MRNAESQATAAEAAVYARSTLAEARVQLEQLSVEAPAADRVEEIYFQVGEWAAANQPIVSLIPDGKVKLRFYVPEADRAIYEIGRQVRFTCDSCATNQRAVITYVDPRPEYTPSIIYSRKSRDRLVYLVEAHLRDAGTLDPDQPVDVTRLARAKAAHR